ncbi:MAG: hypothetical protein VX313_01220, partial [Bacteroidota bacterium]|nr:hypothetical protein [Bacteroidota bacterium]
MILDLSDNNLRTIPTQLEEFNTTKIHVTNNPIECDDCKLIYLLRKISYGTPQIITCSDNANFHFGEVYASCHITAITTTSCLAFVILVAAYMIFRCQKQLKRLKQLKRHFNIKPLSSEEEKNALRKEVEIRGSIDHEKIRKVIYNFSSNIKKRFDHWPITDSILVEKVTCSLHEFTSHHDTSYLKRNTNKLTQDLLEGIDFLHSTKKILHGKIDSQSIYIQIDEWPWNNCRLKIGDFSRAQYISSIQPSQDDSIVMIDESLPLISFDCNCFIDDLLAAARVIFILATGKENMDKNDDLTELPDANYAILYLSLQEGLSAAEAGQLPPFQTLKRRLSLLSKLKKERIQAIVFNTKRDIGKSIWSTSPKVILQEFASLIPVEDVSTLPFILNMAYDLCNIPLDDIQFVRMLLRAFAFLDNCEQAQHFDPDMIIIELDKFGQWIPDFDLVIEDSGVTTMTMKQKGKALALLIQFVREWTLRHEELHMEDLRKSSIK